MRALYAVILESEHEVLRNTIGRQVGGGQVELI